MQRHELEGLSREELIAHAERLGVPRPRVLTQPELIDEIIGRTAKSEREKAKARGWLGRARDLLAKVVERGLHLPDAAKTLRTPSAARTWPTPPPPLPTVTLAEIYAAQGHLERAISVLDEVLAREPDHQEASVLRDRFIDQAQRTRTRVGRPVEASVDEEAPPAEPKEAESPNDAQEKVIGAVESVGIGTTTESMTNPIDEGAAPEAATFAESESEPEAPAGKEPEAAAVAVPEAEPEKVAEPATEIESVNESDSVSAAEPEPAADSASAAEPEPIAAPVVAAAPTLAPEADASEASADETGETTPLPERYNVDEIVAIAVDPQTLYVYWEVRPVTFARAQAKRSAGKLSIRVIAVTPSWDGPVTKAWDMSVDALYGDRFIRDIPPGANVRVTVGWLDEETFEPFAVGLEVAAPRALPAPVSSTEVGRWTSDPAQTVRALRHAGHGGPGGQAGDTYSRALSDTHRIAGPRGGPAARMPGAPAFGGGAGGVADAGRSFGAAPSWMDPAAQRAASPSFSPSYGGASDLSRR